MFELLLCSLLTVFPDYLYRRYVQGKRFGKEINFYSVWFELRWGITACLLLTVSLITMVFYFHPSTTNVTAVFRTVTILPETSGRVAEVFATTNEKVKAGQPLFRLDDAAQAAAVETARRQIAEIEAEKTVAESELATADGQIQQARSALDQAQEELAIQTELRRRNPDTIAMRAIEKLQVVVDGRQGALDAALASKSTQQTRIASALPAAKASAEAQLAQAQVELDRTTVRAGVDGTVQQFVLRPGDVVNPMIRSAGILVPDQAGRGALIAGFGQIEASVLKVGMIAEATCAARPFTILPMVVSQVQDVIAAGQIRPTDALVDVQSIAAPGTITVFLEPLFAGEQIGVPPGSSCIANAYTNNHDALADPSIGTGRWLFLHMVDTVGLVHAMLLRVQALLLPVRTLVLSGGH